MRKQRLVILLLFVLMSVGVNSFAQKVTKSFNSENLKSVLKEVERQSGFSIIYQSDDVNEKKLITASFVDAPVDSVLNRVLDSNLTFSINNKMIVIYRKGKEAQKTESVSDTKTKDISGMITDTGGEPLVGVTVRVRSTGVGATSDIDGQFSLKNVPEDAVLDVTYIGMLPQVLFVADGSSFNIVMADDAKQLDEVVVTAMGIERKAKSLTYATQKLDNEELTRVQDPSFINSLQGKAAGLSITPNSGGAGGASRIILRGNKSVYGNNMPLVVVDGIPMTNRAKGQASADGGGYGLEYGGSGEGSDALSAINPDDIESINILKGANAAAAYGSAASNGVLMITTKKGKEGAMTVGFTSNATFERPLLLPEFQKTYGANVNPAAGSVELESWGKRIADMTPEEMAVKNLTNSAQDYADDFFKTGMTLNNSVSVSGGTEIVRSYFSYANTYSEGIIENNTFKRHVLSFRQNYKLFKERLKVDVSINYLNQNTKNRPGGGIAYNPLYNLYISPRNIDMHYYRDNYKIDNGTWTGNKYDYYRFVEGKNYQKVTVYPELTGPQQNWVFASAKQNNPYWLTKMNNDQADEERVYGYLSGNLKIIDGLTAQGRLSIDRSKAVSYRELYATTQGPAEMIDFGRYDDVRDNTNEFYLDWMLSYNKEFGNYSLSASGGYTAHQMKGNSLRFAIERATIEKTDRVPSAVNVFSPKSGLTGGREIGKTINWDEGLFFTGQVGYKDYLFLEGSYRRDWYRAFKQFHIQRGTPLSYGYYSAGLNALIHDMVRLPAFWNYLKLRASYSEVGNSIPNLMYTSANVDETTGAVQPSGFAYFDNPIPETTKSIEAGFDASFFRNALSWDLTFYNATMHNNYLIVNVVDKKKPVNSGIIRNRGIETTLAYAMNFSSGLRWKTGANFSCNYNKILETYVNPDGKESIIQVPIGISNSVQIIYTKGGKYGDIYVADFLRDDNGKIILNSNGKPSRSTDTSKQPLIYMGNMNADYQLGWYNDFKYKNLSLYFLIDGKIGGKVISFTEAYMDYYGTSARTGEARDIAARDGIAFKGEAGMVLPDGQTTSVRQYYLGSGGEEMVASEYIHDATNFRLRELSLGYTFRDVFGYSKNLSLSLIGRNLFFLYNKAPIDPDTSLSTQNSLGNVDIFGMPATRSIGLSLTITL